MQFDESKGPTLQFSRESGSKGKIEFSLYGKARGFVKLTFKLRFRLGKSSIINQQG